MRSLVFVAVWFMLSVLSACSSNLALTQRNGETVKGKVVAADEHFVTVERRHPTKRSAKERVRIARRFIEDVDHPGDTLIGVGVAVIAPAIGAGIFAAWGLSQAKPKPSDCRLPICALSDEIDRTGHQALRGLSALAVLVSVAGVVSSAALVGKGVALKSDSIDAYEGRTSDALRVEPIIIASEEGGFAGVKATF